MTLQEFAKNNIYAQIVINKMQHLSDEEKLIEMCKIVKEFEININQIIASITPSGQAVDIGIFKKT